MCFCLARVIVIGTRDYLKFTGQKDKYYPNMSMQYALIFKGCKNDIFR